MATILLFPTGAVIDPQTAHDMQSFPPVTPLALADGGIEAIVDLTHYQFLSDEPTEQGADVYLLVRRR